MLLRISAQDYAQAARQLQSGDLNANPLAVALAEHGTYKALSYADNQITLKDVATRRRYTAAVPPVLAEYLAAFQRGVRVMEDYEFELALHSDDK
jgi:hypothetical protein